MLSGSLIGFVLMLSPIVGLAQTGAAPAGAAQQSRPSQTAPAAPQAATPADSPAPTGTVLFSREAPTADGSKGDEPPQPKPGAQAPAAPAPAAPAQPDVVPTQPDPLRVTGAERTSLTFTAYTLDLHLAPAAHGLSARAGLTVRNDGPAPLSRLVLQVSSSLHWEALSIARPGAGLQHLALVSRRLATDADHTGWASEVVAALPEPLAPGASLPLVAVYSGSIPQSAERLERIGAPADQAAAADWDTIAAPAPGSSGTSTALRGFGDVLWYPVSAPPVFLGDGAQLVELAGRTRRREQAATISLRLAVEFAGDPPSTAFFCGRPQPLTAVRDNPDAPAAEGTGVATASFEAQPLGFRVPSLFITDHPATTAGTSANPDLISATTEHFEALASYSAAARLAEPLLREWLGPAPLSPLHLLDYTGQPFEDDAMLVRSVRTEDAAALAQPLVHSLTHAWIRSAHPWIDEGLAQFMVLLWIERTHGRTAALQQLQDAARTIAFAEPDTSGQAADTAQTASKSSSGSSSSSTAPDDSPERREGTGQPLTDPSSDVFFRTKAAAVWWMLRGIVGDDALKQALQTYRTDGKADADPAAMQRILERASHQDLRWFFEDWVYKDRGLPDLAVVTVTPRQIEGTARSRGWLVSVQVRNDGDCVADVPVTVRSAPGAKGAAAASETQRVRIPGHTTVTRRIIFTVPPAEVQVNDGSMPETRVSVHTEQIGPTAP